MTTIEYRLSFAVQMCEGLRELHYGVTDSTSDGSTPLGQVSVLTATTCEDGCGDLAAVWTPRVLRLVMRVYLKIHKNTGAHALSRHIKSFKLTLIPFLSSPEVLSNESSPCGPNAAPALFVHQDIKHQTWQSFAVPM